MFCFSPSLEKMAKATNQVVYRAVVLIGVIRITLGVPVPVPV